ncbi:MAG: PH domain-containing protein [Sphingomonadaceae bacterium]
MTPLHPSQLFVLRIRAAIFAALFVLAAALFVDLPLASEGILPPGTATAPALLVAAALVLWLPRRRYRSWSYAMRPDELHIRSGLWTRSYTVVPFGRVQHLDVNSGPIERRYGLGTLILHTAGTRGSAVSLPGLLRQDAEAMRDEIREKIREDLRREPA